MYPVIKRGANQLLKSRQKHRILLLHLCIITDISSNKKTWNVNCNHIMSSVWTLIIFFCIKIRQSYNNILSFKCAAHILFSHFVIRSSFIRLCKKLYSNLEIRSPCYLFVYGHFLYSFNEWISQSKNCFVFVFSVFLFSSSVSNKTTHRNYSENAKYTGSGS